MVNELVSLIPLVMNWIFTGCSMLAAMCQTKKNFQYLTLGHNFLYSFFFTSYFEKKKKCLTSNWGGDEVCKTRKVLFRERKKDLILCPTIIISTLLLFFFLRRRVFYVLYPFKTWAIMTLHSFLLLFLVLLTALSVITEWNLKEWQTEKEVYLFFIFYLPDLKLQGNNSKFSSSFKKETEKKSQFCPVFERERPISVLKGIYF